MSKHITLRVGARTTHRLGDDVRLFCRDWRVSSIDIAGTTLELRPLRWHERAWRWLTRAV